MDKATFIYPNPTKVSNDHIWYGNNETAVVDGFLSKVENDSILNKISSLQFSPTISITPEQHNLVTDLSAKEEDWQLDKVPGWYNFNASTFYVDKRAAENTDLVSNKMIEEIYWRAINKIRVIQQNRWLLELRGLSPSYHPELYRRVDVWQLPQGSFLNWNSQLSYILKRKDKLMAMIPLSNPQDYSGGELQVFAGQGTQTIPMEAGSLIMYPTYRYMRITPVTRGTLYLLRIMIMGAKNLR